MAELLHRCEVQKNQARKAELDEISELKVIRDELRKIQERVAERPQLISRCLPKEFPTIGALLLRLNALAQQIAKTRPRMIHIGRNF